MDQVRVQKTYDLLNDSVRTLEDILICEAPNDPALTAQELLALVVVSDLFFCPLRCAVDFHNEPF